jgi:pimeloyl-ACP methyl ester carboxylesterase
MQLASLVAPDRLDRHSRRVIVPDVRGGAGKTRWARPGWSTAEMAADIHAITVHLGLRRPAIAGISMGGTIALQYALDHPGDLNPGRA